MAWTSEDLAAIESAIATGARRVRFQTHEVEYQSLNDMLKVRALIRDEIAGQSGGVHFTEYASGA
jgi:hypothetical protein